MDLDKKNAIFLSGVVIPNGVPDLYGDVLNKEDINKLRTSFLNQSKKIDLNHNFLNPIGVDIVENYSTKSIEYRGGKKVPIGSWAATLMVWNEDIIRNVNEKKLNGLSLASKPNDYKVLTDYINRQEAPNYRDFDDKDELTPLMISIVKEAGNGYEFDVYTYDAYIKREKPTEVEKVTNEGQDAMTQLASKMFEYITRNAPAATVDDGVVGKLDEINAKFDTFEENIGKQVDEKLEGVNSAFDEKINTLSDKIEELNNQIDEIDTDSSQTPTDDGDEGGDDGTDGTDQTGADNDQNDGKITRNAPQTQKTESHQRVQSNPVWDDGFKGRRRDELTGLPIQ